jgi:hypothetical protein
MGFPRAVLIVAALLSASVTVMPAQTDGSDAGPDPSAHAPWTAPIVPAPEPFTLNSYDAIDAAWMLRRVGFVQLWDYESRPETIAVESARTVWVDYNPNAYEGHQNRYDVLLNGEPVDWNRTYIEYDNDMINLRLLYTYRNQKPPPDLPYRLRWP